MDNNQVSDNLLGYTPAPDAIQEFNLITSNASAEFGNFEGGIISATIKSGTNSFHGDAWEFFRNDVLNAKSWSNNFKGLPKDKLRWNMFGATFGGPVFKNKLFFFVDYQRQRFDIPSSFGTKSVFTTAERTGDFSALCPAGFTGGVCSSTGKGNEQLYNPCASFTAPCTPSSPQATTRQPFPNNQIPLAMISPVAQALFASSLYPTAIGPSTQLQQNSVNITAKAFNVDQGDMKVDYKATDKDTISGRFTRAYQNNPSTNSQVLFGNGYATTPIYNTVGDWTRLISSSLVNDARMGWSHVTFGSGTSWASGVGQFGNTIGIGNGNPAGLDGLLALNFKNSALDTLGTQESTTSFDDHVWQFEDAITWAHGRHNIKFGGQFWRQIIKTFYAGNNGELGLMDFDGRFTSNTIGSAGTGAGDGGADFFLGLPFQFGRGVSTGKTWEQSSNIIGVYAQDTWRLSDRLTLNAPFTPAEINAIYNNSALPGTSTSDGIVGSGSSASCAAPAYACYAGALLRVWDPKVQPAIADQWNLTIQHQFWGDTTFQIGYVGQRGTHLMVPFDYAQRQLLPNSSCGTPPCTAPSPFFAKNPTLYSVLGHPNATPPKLDATVSGTQSNGTMGYNSLQAVLQKQMGHGLQYQVSYTFSKCMSDSTGYYGAWNNALSASAYWQNVYDKKAEWAPCYYDATHVLSGYAIYELPFGRGKTLARDANKIVNAVIGVRSFSPSIIGSSGWTVTVVNVAGW